MQIGRAGSNPSPPDLSWEHREESPYGTAELALLREDQLLHAAAEGVAHLRIVED